MTRATSQAEAPDAPPKLHFRSTAHPGHQPAALVYARAMVRPLAAVMLPLMLFALAAALQGLVLWPYLAWGAPAALVAAWGWARFQLRRTPAEVRIRFAADLPVAVRSARDVLRGAPLQWHRLGRLRTSREALRLDLGDTSHRLLRRRWPTDEALLEALQRIRQDA